MGRWPRVTDQQRFTNIRDTVLRVLSTWARRAVFLGDPRVNDHSVTDEAIERDFLRNAFKYQHCERVCVGFRRRGGVVVFDELGGQIPESITGRRLRDRDFGALLHNLCHTEVTDLGFALDSV